MISKLKSVEFTNDKKSFISDWNMANHFQQINKGDFSITFNIEGDRKINSRSNTVLSSKKWIVVHLSIRDNNFTNAFLSQLTNMILNGNAEIEKHTGTILINFPKAFNTLDHNILSDKMK